MTPEEESEYDDAVELSTTKRALQDKMIENERLGTQVTNLRLDVQRREEQIAEWKARAQKAELACEVMVNAASAEPHPKTVAWTGDGPCPKPHRMKMPDERRSYTVKLRINDRRGVERCPECKQPTPESPRCSSFTMHVGYHPDSGSILEVFIRPDREKKTDLVASLADGWATSSSYALQNGGDIRWIIDKALYSQDETGGVPLVWDPTSDSYRTHPVFRRVGSVLDYAARIIERLSQGKPATSLTQQEAEERSGHGTD